MGFFVGVDALLVALSVAGAFLLRFDGTLPLAYGRDMAFIAALAIVATIGLLLIYRVYRISWSHVGLRDIAAVAAAVGFSTLVLAGVAQWMYLRSPESAFPRSIVAIQAQLAFIALASFRLSKRLTRALLSQRRVRPLAVRTILVGAGGSGAQVMRSIRDTAASDRYHVVGFVDDDALAHGTSIEGVPVLGPVSRLGDRIRTERAQCVIICVATADSAFVRRVVASCRAAGVNKVRTVPPLSQIVDGRVSVAATRDVSLEDLLGRDPVDIDLGGLRSIIEGRTVAITGGAGTIGAELCRQVARHGAGRIVVVDVDETRLHDIALELREQWRGLDVVEALIDVRDPEGLGDLFSAHRPQLVLHAAAYKHVPMMERYPVAALDVNVLGTARTAEAAERAGCERFVLVSTDKAVEPSSVMGATKRLAEMAVLGSQGTGPDAMVRCAVRFGNVLGSRGSVLTIFERQASNGGPLTVTHPDVERYFMITSEAAALVLQAAALGRGCDLFLLDMGKPVRIVDVAREFCRLKGLVPERDISVVFTGLRPGERLTETLHYANESLEPTAHPRVSRVTAATATWNDDLAEEVRLLVEARDPQKARGFLVARFPSLGGRGDGEPRSMRPPAMPGS